MASKNFSGVKDLLPSVLAKLSRETGRASHLKPVWAEVVGAVTALHSEPIRLDGATLQLRVESPRWHAALVQQEAEIVAKLCARLGEGAVKRIVYEVVEPK